MKLWVKWLITGILSILFGIFVLANPVAASFAVTVVAGTLFIIAGGVQIWGGVGADPGSHPVRVTVGPARRSPRHSS